MHASMELYRRDLSEAPLRHVFGQSSSRKFAPRVVVCLESYHATSSVVFYGTSVNPRGTWRGGEIPRKTADYGIDHTKKKRREKEQPLWDLEGCTRYHA